MDITVEVYSERVSTGERRNTHTAHVVFVAIDETGQAHACTASHPRDEPKSGPAMQRAEAHRLSRPRA